MTVVAQGLAVTFLGTEGREMDASKYLPPFAQGQRGDATADQRDDQGGPTGSDPDGRNRDGRSRDGLTSGGRTAGRQMVGAGGTEHEATYADFLGDQVDD